MTRAEIESDYTVEDGCIVTPGKFEREPVYTPYFWALALESGADEEIVDGCTQFSVFVLEPADFSIWPEIESDTHALVVWETDQGFVEANELTQANLDKFRAECEAAASVDGEEC